ncbi:A-kinase-interacting protein 1-like [Strongylocentrotus purpuratus]|uniref:A-kinase-interacting protein 1 n=1 Tax=Strongylocentrotus purpuratus TaxID=7668 RepID=A0A7M7P5W7_STRPU|nr:A-kinase-interacting protein 1 [Strongylocentrotus purpuratus]XP_030844311.1 A-kinase-interacting protein 1-like [Strongylocentrotus purpuratus]|eukprot:XP_001181019.1 PREDICTED: A-kinase-interacting protein 1 [Strongylocentrotus purpuratus]
MNHSHAEDWMSCTLCRANHQGQQVLERARRREVTWPEPREQGTPPVQDALTYTTINEAFGSILQYMTSSSRQCRRYYSSIPASTHNALDKRHCGRFHAPRYTEPRKTTHPLQKTEDVHIQVQPGTYAVTAGGWGRGKGQQTHVVHVNQGQSVNLDFTM